WGAVHFTPPQERTLLGAQPTTNAPLRLLTWNIGYAELEPDTRAHTQDLPAVAEVILRADPDAVALQELTGAAQLRSLLALLHGRYRGMVAQPGSADRSEAVLVKDSGARFEQIAAGARYAIGANFQARAGGPQLVLVSAHADAFNAARRRAYTEEIVAWAHARQPSALVFVAGDFNFELKAEDETNFYTDDLKHDSEAYSYLLRYFRDLGRAAGATAINDRRIDYIYGPTESARLNRAEVLRDASVGRMGHWPLLIEIAV
ncbi:MAG TPA: endonuclease/exonuclease/phosphatase family protein, partial [Pyrinomonadaceae bacterium]|nr:endonuclease/exonuclease/phosphatase family protein [Pyrinomonadaceae bacterium]